MTNTQRIAYFISPHGFGHAARASAVMESMLTLNSTLRFEIFTTIPAWFFEKSLAEPFGYHTLLTDIGMVQQDTLNEDVPETLNRLNQLFPFDPQLIQNLAKQIRALECKLVICDIAPMGIVVAHTAGTPVVLVENFTWDWIYQGYAGDYPQLNGHIAYLQEVSAMVDVHIQTEPICRREQVDLSTGPASRKLRASPAQVRQSLGVPSQAKMVILTMGGIDWDYAFLKQLESLEGVYVVTAGHTRQVESHGNLIFLSRNSDFFHPDLVNASDAVVGKLGYSTIAEVYQAGVPFGYLIRPKFRESQVMATFVETNMQGFQFEDRQLQDGSWLANLPQLLSLPRVKHNQTSSADEIAGYIYSLLG